jgi:uncharacterized protein
MRYLIVTLALGLIIFWLLRAVRGRPDVPPSKHGQRTSGKSPAQVQDMVSCAHCGLHLPGSEAIKGKLADYCCQEHRRLAET